MKVKISRKFAQLALFVLAIGLSVFTVSMLTQGGALAQNTVTTNSSGANSESPQESPGVGQEIVHGAKDAYHHAAKTVGDAALDVKAKAALHEDKMTRGYDIDVASDNGTVTLSGKVPSRAVAERATQVVARLYGVKDVVDALQYSR